MPRAAPSLVFVLSLFLVLLLPGCVTQLDYTSWEEGLLGMVLTDLFHPEARIYLLGESSSPGIDQVAIKISHDAGDADNGARNSILFECGMHGREWFAAETCWMLVDWLIDNRSSATVEELLDHADVWVLAQTNPAGRLIDDLFQGDPTRYALVCRGGANEGDPCTVNSDCDSNDCYSTGWRTNANRTACAAGVDLARNFSSGWDDAAASCDPSAFMKFRGPHAFSEPESLNLRAFLHNHMISTVVIIHANAQQTWNRWANISIADDFLVDELAAANLAGVTPDTEAAMPRHGVGQGHGQLSAWLTEPSNVAGELDEDTERNISTYFLELPINGADYYNGDYNSHDYQFAAGDGSNSFHPSSSVWQQLWEESIQPMLLDLIRQARSPQCPVDAAGARITAQCRAHDFGLVGAKIATADDEAGQLGYNGVTREEEMIGGNYQVVFAVQNHGTDPARTTSNAEVRFFEDGNLVQTDTVPISLANGDRGVFAVPHHFSIFPQHRVEIELDADDFTADNAKSFAFNATSVLWRPELEVPFRGWTLRWEVANPPDLRMLVDGAFIAPDELVDPGMPLAVRLVTYPPWTPRGGLEPTVTELAPGASSDELQRGERATSSSHRPSPGAAPAVQILDASLRAIGGQGAQTRYHLRLVLGGHGLGDLRTARLVTLDVRIGERLRVSGLQSREPPRRKPPNRHALDDEDEREPG